MLDGNFRASIDLAQPHRSSADGTLRIEGLDLREYADVPVTMERLNVDVTGRTLRVHDSVLRLAGERLAVSGTVEGGGERLVVDARIPLTRLTPRRSCRSSRVTARTRPRQAARGISPSKGVSLSQRHRWLTAVMCSSQ